MWSIFAIGLLAACDKGKRPDGEYTCSWYYSDFFDLAECDGDHLLGVCCLEPRENTCWLETEGGDVYQCAGTLYYECDGAAEDFLDDHCPGWDE